MLPPSLADFDFAEPIHGTDDALAQRAGTAAGPGARILVLGAGRLGLLRGLVVRGVRVVAIDTSRSALRRASAELGTDAQLELLAADPREFNITGHADAALITSSYWRAVEQREDRVAVLRQFLKATRGSGRLLVDLEAAPGAGATGARGPLRWQRDPSNGVTIQATLPGEDGDDLHVSFACFDDADAAREIADAGFGGTARQGIGIERPGGPTSPRFWITAERRA